MWRQPVDWTSTHDWVELRKYRLERLAHAMDQYGLDALLLTRLDAIRYATSFRPIYSMWFYGTRYVAIVTREKNVAFLVASGDIARVSATMPWLSDLTPFPFSMIDGVSLIASTLRRLGLQAGRIGIDLVPFGVFLALKDAVPRAEFRDGMPALEEARKIKHPLEIEMLREVAQIADLGMQVALETVRFGVTEMEVSTKAVAAMMSAGSEDIPYYPLVISGPNVWLKYRFPTFRRMGWGEMVWIDCGACIFNGYNGDIARIAVVGKRISKEQAKIYKTVYEMLQAVISLARPGTMVRQLVEAAMEVARRAGYEQFTSPVILGHGIGTDLHESPAIGDPVGPRTSPSERIEAGMVLSFEPGIIVPGVGGGHLEDMVAIHDSGPEVLTHTPFEADYLSYPL